MVCGEFVVIMIELCDYMRVDRFSKMWVITAKRFKMVPCGEMKRGEWRRRDLEVVRTVCQTSLLIMGVIAMSKRVEGEWCGE